MLAWTDSRSQIAVTDSRVARPGVCYDEYGKPLQREPGRAEDVDELEAVRRGWCFGEAGKASAGRNGADGGVGGVGGKAVASGKPGLAQRLPHNSACRTGQSQRDCGTQPRVAKYELPQSSAVAIAKGVKYQSIQ